MKERLTASTLRGEVSVMATPVKPLKGVWVHGTPYKEGKWSVTVGKEGKRLFDAFPSEKEAFKVARRLWSLRHDWSEVRVSSDLAPSTKAAVESQRRTLIHQFGW